MESPVLNVENWVTLFTLLWCYLWPSCGEMVPASTAEGNEMTQASIVKEFLMKLGVHISSRESHIVPKRTALKDVCHSIICAVTIGDNLSVHHQEIGRVKCGKCRTLWRNQKQMTRTTHTYLKNIVFYSYCGIILNSKIVIFKITNSCKKLYDSHRY